MLKKVYQKIRRNHLLMMVICCLLPLVLIVWLVPLFSGNNSYGFWLIMLLCPLMHVWMMKGHKHDVTRNQRDMSCVDMQNADLDKKKSDKRKSVSCCNQETTQHALKK